MSEKIGSIRTVSKILGFGIAATALVGCSTDKEGSWVFEVKCPEDTSIDVTRVTSYGTVDFQCGSESEPLAPISIELINGEGINVDDSGEVTGQLLTLDYVYTDEFLLDIEPVLTNVQILESSAIITTKNAVLTGVEVTEGQK